MTEVPADWLDQAARREAEEQARASALGTNTTTPRRPAGDSEDAIDIAEARRALADPAPSIPLGEVLARNADPRTVLRDRIAAAMRSVEMAPSIRAHIPYGRLLDAVMELFPDVWEQHTIDGVCYVARTPVVLYAALIVSGEPTIGALYEHVRENGPVVVDGWSITAWSEGSTE